MPPEPPRIVRAMSTKIRRQADYPRKRRWTAAEIELLGKEPDTRIARKLKIAASTVAAERRRRDIPAYRAAFEWTEEALSLLGTDTDERIAARLGISRPVVGRKRRELETPAFMPRRGRAPAQPDPFWTPERDALLGTAADPVIARRLGVSAGRVYGRRRKLGIAPAYVVPRYDWTEIDPLLGTEFDREVAARFGMHPKTVHRRRLKLKIPACRPERLTIRRDDALRRLLRRPGSEIDELPRSTVAELRKELGIKAPPPRNRWTPEVLERLGEEDDAVIAEELGVSVKTVALKRRSLGRLKRTRRRRGGAGDG